MPSNTKATSPYYDTPIVNFYLDILEYRPIPPNEEDDIMVIDPRFEKRPDLMAFHIYGTPRLWWVFAVRNPDILVDPIEDFVSGLSIFIPARDTLENLV